MTHVSQKTVEVLGDWLLESALVQSTSSAQEQRRRQFKSNALINKTMKQSQEERRRIALAEQAKKRYQFTNHARKLARFANGQPSEEGSSDSEDDDSQNEDEDEDEEEDDDDEDIHNDDGQDNSNNVSARKKKKKRSSKQITTTASADSGKDSSEGRSTMETKATAAHKRRLSSGSESELTAGRKVDKTGDVLSPKKPRLQKTSPKTPKKKKKKDRNPFRDQLMIPEIMTEIPLDLDTNYYLVPLPIGHRCFVISADGKTTARLPSGQLLVSPFESCLPAGSSQYRGNRRTDYCILDCVYSSVTRTFWTLDIMCWRGHPVYECESEFRFWWLRGKLAEIESLQTKWVATQAREWEQEAAKRKQKKARQLKRKQERAAAAAAMDVVPLEENGDDGDDEAGPEGMDIEDHHSTRADGSQAGSPFARKFWPIVFTPLPYFNASIDLIRLLAESMIQPTPSPSLTASTTGESSSVRDTSNPSVSLDLVSASTSNAASAGIVPPVSPAAETSSSSSLFLSASKWAPATTFSAKPSTVNSLAMTMSSSMNISNGNGHHHHHQSNGHSHGHDTNSSSSKPHDPAKQVTVPVSDAPLCTLGTMALSGEIASAASLYPAHDKTQKLRQEQALVHERAAGLVFFNKKTMYVLGMTPLCGWVPMNQIGDVFFNEEGGIGPVPGTSAVEGREVEMEDALERIRI